MEVVAPGGVAVGSGETPEVGSADGVGRSERVGEVIQELFGGDGLGLDGALRGPDRLPLHVGVE